jgi:hypothetical protein
MLGRSTPSGRHLNHHDELAGEQAALDAEMTELHQCKPALGTERGTAIDYTKA